MENNTYELFKVYIAKLKRTSGYPRVVLKIGITSYSNAEDRLKYREADEPFPILNYFSDIKIMKSSRKIYSREEAEKIEAYIMDQIKGNNRYFHNWRENDPISGITEMRIWNYEEFLKAIKLLDEAINKLVVPV
jgi:hypothetical protein